MSKQQIINLSGETIDIMCDPKVRKLNIMLATQGACPLILLQDWTKEDHSKTILTLHLKEAIQLKSMIDNAVLDYTLDKIEHIN